MGLRCSLLGHAYGEPVTERDRERRGDEEVVTVTKLRTCNRCGAETVLSENTEVRHLDSVREWVDQRSPAGDDAQESGQTHESEPTTPAAEPTPETAESETEADVSELIETAEKGETEATETEALDTGSPDADVEPTPDDAESDDAEPGDAKSDDAKPGDAEADDGIIIEDSTDSTDESETAPPSDPPPQPPDSLEPDEQPPTGRDSIDDIEETAAEAANEPMADRPESGTADQPRDATDSTAAPESMFGTAGEEAVDREPDSTDAEPDERRDAWKERPPSETPHPADTSNPADETAEGRTDPAFQFESPGDTENEAGSSTPAQRGPSGIASEGPLEVDVEGETPYESLVCPECGFSESAVSSLRAGDICPECHRGYLAGRR